MDKIINKIIKMKHKIGKRKIKMQRKKGIKKKINSKEENYYLRDMLS